MDVKIILMGAWPCHVPKLFNQQERENILRRNDASSRKKEGSEMLEGSEM